MAADTVGYYERNADAFVAGTMGVDMAPLRARFLAHLPPRATILDAGCGSGRDARAFLELSHEVVAMDASPAMAQRAAALIGLPVLCLPFEEMTFEAAFEGIWASASLLHVPRRAMGDVLARFVRALQPGGIWYMSFKLGDGERIKDGRLFNDQDETSLRLALAPFPGLEVIELWRTADRRPGRADETWLNALVRQAI